MFHFTNCNVTVENAGEKSLNTKSTVITNLEVELNTQRELVISKDAKIANLQKGFDLLTIENKELKQKLQSSKDKLEDLKVSNTKVIYNIEDDCNKKLADLEETHLDKLNDLNDKLIDANNTISDLELDIKELNSQIKPVTEVKLPIIKKPIIISKKPIPAPTKTILVEDSYFYDDFRYANSLVRGEGKYLAIGNNTEDALAKVNLDGMDFKYVLKRGIGVSRTATYQNIEYFIHSVGRKYLPKMYDKQIPLTHKRFNNMDFSYLPKDSTHTCSDEILDYIAPFTNHSKDYISKTYTSLFLQTLANGSSDDMLKEFQLIKKSFTPEDEQVHKTPMLKHYNLLCTFATAKDIEGGDKSFEDILKQADKLFPTAKVVNALAHGKGDNKPQLLGHSTKTIDEKIKEIKISSSASKELVQVSDSMSEFVYKLDAIEDLVLPTNKMFDAEKAETPKGKRASKKNAMIRAYDNLKSALNENKDFYKTVLDIFPKNPSKLSRVNLVSEFKSLLDAITRLHVPGPGNEPTKKQNKVDGYTHTKIDKTIHILSVDKIINEKIANGYIDDIKYNVSVKEHPRLLSFGTDDSEKQLSVLNKSVSKVYTNAKAPHKYANNIVKDSTEYYFYSIEVKNKIDELFLLVDENQVTKDDFESTCDIILSDYLEDGEAPELFKAGKNVDEMIKSFNAKNDGDNYFTTNLKHIIKQGKKVYTFISVGIKSSINSNIESLQSYQSRINQDYSNNSNFNTVKKYLDFVPTSENILSKFIGKLSLQGVRPIYLDLVNNYAVKRGELTDNQLLEIYKACINHILKIKE